MPRAEPPETLPVAAARAGDRAAWDCLLRRYQLPLFTFVKELIRNEAESLDVVQETFIRAVRHVATLREDRRFGSWLFGIAHQLCAQRARRAGREEALDEQYDQTPDDTLEHPGETLVRSEDVASLLALIGRLPETQRAAFSLHVLEEFTLEEIATITGAPLGTVKSRIHHAKLSLRGWLTASHLLYS